MASVAYTNPLLRKGPCALPGGEADTVLYRLHMFSKEAGETPRSGRLFPVAVTATLLVTLCMELLWSHLRLFWEDELFEYYSDARPGLGAVLQGQLHFPFSLEPPAFHLLLHGMQALAPRHPEFITRLPSMIALLVTQLCCCVLTYRLTRRSGAALLATVMPFFLVTVDYGPEARVYSVLTAFFALSLLCYEEATRDEAQHRTLALWGLFLASGAEVLLHFYAVVFLIPILLGETLRIFRRRRLDLPLTASIVAAYALFALNVPFLRPLRAVRAHYYKPAEMGWGNILFTYEWLVFHLGAYLDRNVSIAHIRLNGARMCTVALIALGVVLYRKLRAGWRTLPGLPAILAAYGALLLPVISVAAAHFVTHAYVARYSLPACVGLAVLLPFVMAQQPRALAVLTISLLAASLVYAGRHVVIAQNDRTIRLGEDQPSPALLYAWRSVPDHHVYVQDIARYLEVRQYVPPSLQGDLIGLYSLPEEMAWRKRDTSSLFAHNMQASTPVPFLAYERLRTLPGPHLLLVYSDPTEEWIDSALPTVARSIEPMGSAFGGRLFRVTF
jgi:hypothetical protein